MTKVRENHGTRTAESPTKTSSSQLAGNYWASERGEGRRAPPRGSSGVVRHGKSAGLCRFRCRSASCGRTFHALTGTNLAGLRHKSKWSVFEACLRDRLTLHQSAERCGISYRTAFLWRNRLLGKQQKGSSLKGIVEMDETYFLESCKGDHSFFNLR